ncbi:MAG: hypothetical protein ACI85I_002245, partial [Arenicella sp.]
MKIIRFVFLVSVAFLLLGSGEKEEKGCTLTVNIEDIKTDNGYILLILFKGENGFPTQQDKAYTYDGVKVSDKKAVFTFKNLPSGTYAIAALHDANSNGKLDTNFLGIPKEDFGASNDAKVSFGPPKYQDAK